MAEMGRPKKYVGKMLRSDFRTFLRLVTNQDQFQACLEQKLTEFRLTQGNIQVAVFLTRHLAWGWAIAQPQSKLTKGGWEPSWASGFHPEEAFVPIAQAEHGFKGDIFQPKHWELSPLFDRLLDELVEAYEKGAFF